MTGRAKYSEKGVLSFDIVNHGSKAPIATIISTHLQHSEIPGNPVDDDRISRALQMNKIVNQISTKIEQNRAVIFTGDLNQDESEINEFLKQNQIRWLRRDASVQGVSTWGGDKWCSDLMGKPSSGPLTLDYTWIAGKAVAIFTQVVEVGFSGCKFSSKATSDHSLLLSTVTVSQ